MHPRRRCINSFANILLGNPQPAEPEPPTYPISEIEDRVYKNRRSALWDEQLPCVCLFALTEESDTDEEPKYYRRKFRLVAEIVVEANETSDELCDEIALKIENLVLHERFLKDPAFDYQGTPWTGSPEDDPANTADDIKMVATAIGLIGENKEGNKTTCRIAFEIEYNSTPAYAVAEDIFDTMSAKYKVPGKDSNTPTADDLQTDINQEE